MLLVDGLDEKGGVEVWVGMYVDYFCKWGIGNGLRKNEFWRARRSFGINL